MQAVRDIALTAAGGDGWVITETRDSCDSTSSQLCKDFLSALLTRYRPMARVSIS